MCHWKMLWRERNSENSITITGATLGCVFLETVCINVILPVAQCDLDLTSQNKGLLSGIGFVGIIMSSHLWGFLADTRGRKTIIVPTLLTFWLLVVLRFLNGFFISGPSATIFAYLGEFHCLQHRSKVIMLGSTMYAFFCFWKPIFASIIINQKCIIYIEPLNLLFKPWRLFMIIFGMPSVICGLFMPESPKFTFSHGDEQRTINILQRMYACNTGKSRDSFDVISLMKDGEFDQSNKGKSTNFFTFMWRQTVPLFKHPHLKNTLTVCFMQFCILNSSNGFWSFFPEIMNRIAIWRADPSHVTSTVCQILDDTYITPNGNETLCVTALETFAFENMYILNSIYAVGWLFIAIIINRVGKLSIITTLLFSGGTCAFSLIFIDQPLISSYLYICLLAVGLVMTVVNATTVELFPTSLRAMALCLSLMCGRFGGFVGTNVVGSLLELLDDYCDYTFVMPTVLLILSGCLAFTIPNISKKISS